MSIVEKRETPQSRYDKAHTKTYGVKVVIKTERDVYERLEAIPNKSGYIKDLIRKDIAESAKVAKESEK